MIGRARAKIPEKSRLAPETSVTVFMWVTLNRHEDVPVMLRHRLNVKRPVGKSALIAGVACWIKTHAPDIRVVGVCSYGPGAWP